jgi:thiamine transport system permease protein
MARDAQPVRRVRWSGWAALAFVLALALGTFGAVLSRAEGFGALRPADWTALRFTVLQAALSAALSVGLAIPVARALARRRFPGRAFMIAALGAPFLLPVIVAVMGILALFGRSGLASDMLAFFGLGPLPIYGLQGILLAHLFLNLPLAARMILIGWAAIPAERLRTAAALGFGPREMFRFVEWPMLRAVLPGAALAIFLVCLSSFTVVLVMGGGPRATTLELAIYQAFRLEFDLAHAASLAALQMILSLAVAALGLRALAPAAFGAGMGRPNPQWPAGGRAADAHWLAAAALFLALPLALVAAAGLPHLPTLPAAIWPAALRSILVALGATALAITLALSLGLLISALPPRRARLIDGAAMLTMTASPLVMGTGLFLILRAVTDPVAAALPVTMLVNAAMALPFCLRILMPDLIALLADYGRLADSLGLAGLARLRLLTLPRLRRPLAFAAGLSAALSMGDLGVIALFADPARATLPMQIYGLMGAYRMDQAAAAALLLLGLSFGLFWLLDRTGRRDADA